jgi:hypothetical protein
MPGELVPIMLAAIIGGTILGSHVIRLIGKYLDRRMGPADPEQVTALQREVERLRDRVEAVEDLSARMVELEERMDFAERVLTQRRQDQLPGGA